MKNIGFIPLRKGSKGILNKNKRKILGRPLFTWVLTEAIFSDLDEVVVFTDDQWIIDFVKNQYNWTSKLKAVFRSEASASDTASTEEAILEYCKSIAYSFDSFTLLQATSPFTSRNDINSSLELLKNGNDSVLSVVRTHRFVWNEDGTPINYNFQVRPRRQDFNGLLVENGAVYSTMKAALKQSGNRISGKIAMLEMTETSYHEVDSETDWMVVEQLLQQRLKESKEFNKIKYLVLDVDGVFTPGTIIYTKDGEHSKVFDMRDGMGLEILREHGVQVIVITSENSGLVGKRMEKLQIEDFYLGVKDKFSKLQYLASKKGFSFSELAYVGDDVNDLACLCAVGWSLIPNNATENVKRHADTVLTKNSGDGAIREASDFILNYNKRF